LDRLVKQSYAKEVPSTGATDQEYVLATAIVDLVDGWCAAGPVALVFDDLQWADPSSLLVLNRLSRGIDQLPLLIATACQPTPRSRELYGLLHALHINGAVSLTLGPLDDSSVALLVERLRGASPDRVLLDQAADAAGNPLYVKELVD